jgi:hypothetical protein
MKQRRRQSVCLLLLLFSFLFQWESTQMLAWSRMILDYSQNRSITQAIGETFSGEQPCPMCCKLTQAKTASTNDEAFQATTLPLADLYAPDFFVWGTGFTGSLRGRSTEPLLLCTDRLSPPSPPPRFFSC